MTGNKVRKKSPRHWQPATDGQVAQKPCKQGTGQGPARALVGSATAPAATGKLGRASPARSGSNPLGLLRELPACENRKSYRSSADHRPKDCALAARASKTSSATRQRRSGTARKRMTAQVGTGRQSLVDPALRSEGRSRAARPARITLRRARGPIRAEVRFPIPIPAIMPALPGIPGSARS
jgi:hypothetical protein